MTNVHENIFVIQKSEFNEKLRRMATERHVPCKMMEKSLNITKAKTIIHKDFNKTMHKKIQNFFHTFRNEQKQSKLIIQDSSLRPPDVMPTF